MANSKVVSPLRLQTFRDDRNNTQTFQWVLSEYDADQLARWKSVVAGDEVIVQEVNTVDIVGEMYFYVTKNTTAAGAVLTASQTPTLTLGGACTYGGDLVPFSIDADIFNLNAFQVLLNGVRQVKGEDVIFMGQEEESGSGESYALLKFMKRLQVGDTIVLDYYRGV